MNIFAKKIPQPSMYDKIKTYGQSAIADPRAALASAQTYGKEKYSKIKSDPSKAFSSASKYAQGAVSSGISAASGLGHGAINSSKMSFSQKIATKAALTGVGVGAQLTNYSFGKLNRAVANSALPPPPKPVKKGWFGGKKSKRIRRRRHKKTRKATKK